MARQASHNGFAILMVLVVLAVAATLMVSYARLCADRAIDAADATQALQVKWGAISCQAECLNQAERMLAQQETVVSAPVVTTCKTVTLGGIRFDLVIGDEQAKMNVNHVSQQQGPGMLTASIMRLQAFCRRPLSVALAPATVAKGSIGAFPIAFGTFDQVLVCRSVHDLMDLQSIDDAVTQRITCWGDGKVNVKRAGTDVMREAMAGVLTEAELKKIETFRGRNPDCSLQEIRKHLELPDDRAGKFMNAAVDSSGCHSLWIVATGLTRSWHRLYVRQDLAGSDGQNWIFEW